MKNFSKEHRGFTLVELLLYVAIASMILLSVSFFLSALLGSRVKSQTVAEVDEQGLQAMQIMTQTVRNAAAVNSPATGASDTSLSVNTPVSANNPTVFDTANGAIRMKEGAATATPLINSRVAASNVSFSNLSGSIRIQFTLAAVDSSGRSENIYSKNFTGSATLR
jgi:prepilin-type N-terminal cleavage/methylation domain-containing protein